MNSVLVLVHFLWVIYFPIRYGRKLLQKFHLLDDEEVQSELEFMLEENKFDTKLRALYQIFFMGRRFLTALILTLMSDWPFFQCTIMMIFSTINLIYLYVVQPMQTRTENRLAVFNELCITIFSHFMTNMLNIAIPQNLFESLGVGLIAVVSFNIGVNLIAIGSQSINQLYVQTKMKTIRFKIERNIDKRLVGRRILKDEFGFELKHHEDNLLEQEALAFCKDWVDHRKWLK